MDALFLDTLIFQGVVEFDSPGNSWRFVRSGPGIYQRYVRRGDAYRYDGTVSITGKATPRKLFAANETVS